MAFFLLKKLFSTENNSYIMGGNARGIRSNNQGKWQASITGIGRIFGRKSPQKPSGNGWGG